MQASNGLLLPPKPSYRASKLVLPNRLGQDSRMDRQRRLISTARDIERSDMLLAAAFMLLALDGARTDTVDLSSLVDGLAHFASGDVDGSDLPALLAALQADEASVIDRLVFEAATASRAVNGFSFADAAIPAQPSQIFSHALVVDHPMMDDASLAFAGSAQLFDFTELVAQADIVPYRVAGADRMVADEAFVAMAATDSFLLAEDYNHVAPTEAIYHGHDIDYGIALPLPADSIAADPVLAGEIAAFLPADVDTFGAGTDGSAQLALHDFAFHDFV